MNNDDNNIVSVSVPLPIFYPLTYNWPQNLGSKPLPGTRVLVSLRGRKEVGIVVDENITIEKEFKIQSVEKQLDKFNVFSSELLGFIKTASDYYFFPFGEALKAALPSRLWLSQSIVSLIVSTDIPMYFEFTQNMPEQIKLTPQMKNLIKLKENKKIVSWFDIEQISNKPAQLVARAIELGYLELIDNKEEEETNNEQYKINPPFDLSGEQKKAVEIINNAIQKKSYQGILLHGVTGSGKTEVYIQSIIKILNIGKSAIVLVPEISLTPQLVEKFRERFGDTVAVMHSGLTDWERAYQWWLIKKGFRKIVIGARSAIFAPLPDVGLIIVDEEHDSSFKQEEGFRYNARDLALLRAKNNNGIAILGSATPSIDSYRNMQRKMLKLIELPQRVTPHQIPEIEILDLKKNLWGATGGILTTRLIKSIEQEINKNNQVILFLNRRGFAPAVICENCGEPILCADCSVAMTYHKSFNALQCHYCGSEIPLPDRCPVCMNSSLQLVGRGTELIENYLIETFPQSVIARLDSDLSSKKILKTIQLLREKKINIVIGTQMITKGHDLPDVTFVGVISADLTLYIPDFRSSERTFQLLTQVSGRAGRGNEKGTVIIQTFQPTHPSIYFAANNDYSSFFNEEIKGRQALGYPPFSHLALIGIIGKNQDKTEQASEFVATFLKKQQEILNGQVEILGPAPSPIFKLRSSFRFRILLRCSDRKPLRNLIKKLLSNFPKLSYSGAKIIIDIDPYNML